MSPITELARDEYTTLDAEQPISKFIGAVTNTQDLVAVITKDNAYVGMANVHQLLRSRIDISTTKMQFLAEKVHSLSAEDSFAHVTEMFAQTPHQALPVLEDKRVVGVVYREDVLKQLGLDKQHEITLSRTATVGEAINVFRENKLYAAQVTQEEIVTGAVQLQDIITTYYAHDTSRDEGMKPRQGTQAFRAENKRLLDFPITSLIKSLDEVDAYALFDRQALQEAVKKAPARNVRFTGFELSKMQQAEIESLVEDLQRKLSVHAEHDLYVHLKAYHEKGERQKISVSANARLSDGSRLDASADEWDVVAALRSVMEKLEWQVRKHSETTK
ncbi:MAG: CBS domain-containing protein [Candidatus Woesearchaeota archaeon]